MIFFTNHYFPTCKETNNVNDTMQRNNNNSLFVLTLLLHSTLIVVVLDRYLEQFNATAIEKR